MNRRSFLGNVGKGAVAVAAAGIISVKAADVEAVPVAQGLAEVARVTPGTAHFAVLMNVHGVAVQTMLVNNLPQEIHVQLDGDGKGPDLGDPKEHQGVCIFRLSSVDRYDGRTVEGLARYIQWQGRLPATWGPIRLGL